MATSLSPELLAQLKALSQADGSLYSGGQMYQPMYSQNQGADAGPAELLGYLGYDPNKKAVGDPNQQWKTSGEFSHNGEFRDPEGNLLPIALAAMAGLGFGLPALMGAQGAGAGSAAGFLGEGAASGIGAWDSALAGAMPGGTGAVGSAAGFVGEGAASGIPGWDAAAAGVSPASAAGGSSLLSGLGGSKALGAATTLLGGLSGAGGGGGGSGGAGGQGTLDPRFEDAIHGPNGLRQLGMGLLATQMPQARQNGQMLMDAGKGLLGRGVAGNPFLRGA